MGASNTGRFRPGKEPLGEKGQTRSCGSMRRKRLSVGLDSVSARIAHVVGEEQGTVTFLGWFQFLYSPWAPRQESENKRVLEESGDKWDVDSYFELGLVRDRGWNTKNVAPKFSKAFCLEDDRRS